jgi:hypothetical protein
MGKTILAAVIAAILASIATTLVMQSVADDQSRLLEQRLQEAEAVAADAESRVVTALDRLDRFGDRVQRTEVAVSEAQQNALSAVQAAGAEPAEGTDGLKAPDGTPYVSRAELDELLAERPELGPGFEYTPPPPPKDLGEIAEEMGLTAQQESTLRVILRDAEQEMVNMLFGNRPIEDVIADARRAKEDPEFQAEMIQGVIMRGVSNAGKVMTWESRLRKKVRGVLGDPQTDEFLSKPRKPILDDSLDTVFEEIFD